MNQAALRLALHWRRGMQEIVAAMARGPKPPRDRDA